MGGVLIFSNYADMLLLYNYYKQLDAFFEFMRINK